MTFSRVKVYYILRKLFDKTILYIPPAGLPPGRPGGDAAAPPARPPLAAAAAAAAETDPPPGRY